MPVKITTQMEATCERCGKKWTGVSKDVYPEGWSKLNIWALGRGFVSLRLICDTCVNSFKKWSERKD